MKIGIASDHRGYELKEKIIATMTDYDFIDLGTNSGESTDYPDYAFLLGEAIRDKRAEFGIAICGSGIGISIACNKVKGVRCASVKTVDDVVATRQDNNANIIAISEKISLEEAKKMIITLIETKYLNLERHQRRIDKITRYENEH